MFSPSSILIGIMHFTIASEETGFFTESSADFSLFPPAGFLQWLDELELAHCVVKVPDLILSGCGFLFHDAAD
jgi:hypothetical protein